MRTLSKKSSPWLRARWPSLLSGLPLVTPGRARGALGRAPAADVAALLVLDERHDDLPHEVRVAGHGGEAERHGGHAQADRKPGAAPAELLPENPGAPR